MFSNVFGLLTSCFFWFDSVGWLYKWLNRQLTLIVFISIHAITIALVPFLGAVWALYVNMVVNGIGGGAWDSSNSIWMVEMWPKSNAFLLQTTQFAYGLGTTVGPLFTSLFVYGDTNATLNVTAETRRSSLTFPFVLTGFLQVASMCIELLLFPSDLFVPFAAPAIFLVMYFLNRYEKPNTVIDIPALRRASMFSIKSLPHIEMPADVKEDDSIKNIKYRTLKLALVAITISSYASVEVNYMAYSPTMFQYLEIHMEAPEASIVLSILCSAYALGRIMTAFISLRLSPDIILGYHLLIIIGSQAMLYVGRDNRTIIYVGSILCGRIVFKLCTFSNGFCFKDLASPPCGQDCWRSPRTIFA